MPFRPALHRPASFRPAKANNNRPSAAKRGYDARWRLYREWFLSQPENVLCKWRGCHQPATVVDHIKPHKGDYGLFWDPANHQGLCKPHHDMKTAREDGGFGRPAKERS
jgi:5-methylcytosine-specific restriction enzyme A